MSKGGAHDGNGACFRNPASDAISGDFSEVVGRSNSVNEIDVLLVLGLLFVVPLGLSMVTWTDPQAERLRSIALKAVPFAAVLGSLSIIPRDAGYQDSVGGVLAGLWLAVCLMVALSALAELARSRPSRPEGYLQIAACVFLFVAAVWMVLYRADVRPLDLPIEIVELTAIHFLYAGFATPVMAYQAARWLRALPGRWDRLAAYAGLGVVLSMMLIAAGITGSPLIEMEGSVIMALSLIAIAAGTTLIAWRLPVPARVLLIISSACVWIAMVLAVQYAVGQYLVTNSLSVRDMARTHGVLTLVFAVCGLGGWKLAGKKVRLGRRPEPSAAEPAEAEPAPAVELE